MATTTKKKTTTAARTDVGAQGVVNEVVNSEMEVNNDVTEVVKETVVTKTVPAKEVVVEHVDWIHRHI